MLSKLNYLKRKEERNVHKNHFVRSELATISPKIEANTHMSKEPMDEPAQSVSHVNIPSNDSPQSQAHDVGSQVKTPEVSLKEIQWRYF